MKIKNNWKEIKKARNLPMSPLKIWSLGFFAGIISTVIVLTIIGLLLK